MKVKIITKIEELPKLSTIEPTFCDIETEQLYVGTRLIQFYQPTTDDTIYIFDVAPLGYSQKDYDNILNQVTTYLSDFHTVWYNSSYDLGTLNFITAKVDDLFYAIKTAYCHFIEFNLDKVVDKLGFGHLYKSLDKKSLQKAGFKKGAYLSQAQIQYSATDVYALSLMWADPKIQDVIENNLAYKVDMLSQIYAIQYQQNGLLVDLPKREILLEKCIKDIARLRLEFPVGFNPNSYKQVREYLGVEESDHDALVIYSLSDKPLAGKAAALTELKRAIKEKSYLESINYDKMYTKFNVAGAATGRFTSSGGDIPNGFNAQQIPRRFQPLFKADTDTTTVVGLDYSTLELRLACAIFNEPEMYRQLKEGEDLHTSMAISSTGKELHPDGLLGSDYDTIHDSSNKGTKFVTKTDRTLAKSINFGYVFGMSAKTYQNYAFVSYGVKVSLEESTALRNKYFTKYPGIKKYHEYVWNNYSKPSFFYETALGRKVKPKLGTDGINGPVQGSGAETTKLAVHFLIKEYPEALKLIFNVVHDAIYLRVLKEDKELWQSRLAKAMVKGWTEISKSKLFKFKDIPMPVDE